MNAFPTQPEKLTAPWLTTILRDKQSLASDRAVVSFTVDPIGDGIGLLGLVVRVELTYDGVVGAGPASVVIKFAHPLEANRAIAMNTRMYEREVTFFNDIAASIKMALPACYFAAVNATTGENIVVLEDLRAYRPADQVVGVGVDEARKIIDSFVPLHASFWGNTDQEMLKTVMRIDKTYIEPFMPGVEATWQNCVAQFDYCIAPDVLPELARYVEGLRAVARMNGQRTQTLVHGDVRLDNVMFGQGAAQHPVVLIDWQAVMISNPMQDMSYLLSQSLTIETRRTHETDLVRYYHARLSEHGVNGYSLEQCWADYDLGILFLLSYPLIIGGAFDPANERGKRLAEEVLRRSSQAVSDRSLFSLLP